MMYEKAIAYIRVSSEEQSVQGVSLDAQDEKIRMYAKLRGLELVTIYREESVSAKVPLRDRPEGSKLVKAIAKKQAKHVLTVKLDRLFRNAQDALQQSEDWNRAKIALHILDMGGEHINTASAVGKMFFTMMAGFAEMERNLISERTKAALSFKKSQHRVYTNITPLGFDRQGDDLVKNKGEMQTVKSILTMRQDGLSMQAIADALNAQGAATKQGGNWYPSTVANILKIHKFTKKAA